MKNIYFLLLVWSGLASAVPVTPFGRYIGVLRHEGQKRDQLAKLDFISSREENNTLVLKAVLTLHFGDFQSGEYVGYHFDNVRFNLLTQSFVFDQADQPITLVVKKFTGDEFEGEFRSAYSGEINRAYLSKGKTPELKYPLLEPIWGEYSGKCLNKGSGVMVDTKVQLYTYRSNEGATQVGNPFRAYRIAGFIGEDTGTYCLSGETKMCVWGNVRSGSYNFYRNSLVVFNNYRNLVCTTTAEGLQCQGCDFLKRDSKETAGPRALVPPEAKSKLGDITAGDAPALVDDVESIQGDYVGYVHHEYLDVYQPGGVTILTYQAPANDGAAPTLRMSAIANLSFGEDNPVETLNYRFLERSYPNPLAVPQFVFEQPNAGADVDAILQVTYLGKGWVKGTWFSRLFGRVGEFVFHKVTRPQLPEGVKKMEPISGYFQSSNWEMELMVGMGSAQEDTVNPFSPLTLGGWVIMPGVTTKKHILNGSYDFYTGRIGVDDLEFPIHIGQRLSRQKLLLKKFRLAVMAPLPPHEMSPFRLLEGIDP